MLRRYQPLRAHPQRDPVSHQLHAEVIFRDKECVAAKLGFTHECRNAFGQLHPSTATGQLTVEHVKDDLAMGRRAPSTRRTLVALCHSRNVAVPSRAMRTAFRDYLARIEA
jgi:hypothetical protein